MKILESATIRELAIDAAFICHIFIFHKDRTIVNFRKVLCWPFYIRIEVLRMG